MKIYLIRHGQTTGDIEERYGGDYDDHLTETGKRQAENLARELADFNIEKIFCSPLIRARETAEIIKQKIRCKIEIVEDLRERNRFGIFTGMKILEAKEKSPNLAEVLKDYRTNIEGGESYTNFEERVEKSFSEILKSKHKTIAVVTHAGPIKVIFFKILKAGTVKIKDCGFAELERFNGKLKALQLNGVRFEK